MTLPANRAEDYSRVDLVMDSGFNYPSVEKDFGSPDKRSIELAELRRLFASAKDERRRASLQQEIDLLISPQSHPRSLSDVLESGWRGHHNKGVRPWSARPVSARRQAVQVMKTIPESKQHIRPLSSKMLGSGIGAIPLALSNERKPRGESGSSVSSAGSHDSMEDELDRHEMKYLWSTSFDTRHPVSNVVDRSSATFWMSSGLYPQLLGFQFRRTILLWKVMLYCAGVRSLRLHWRLALGEERWSHLQQSCDCSNQEAVLNEFEFNLASAAGNNNAQETTAVKLEVLDGSNFAIVRHLTFVEQPSSKHGDNVELRF